MTPVFLSLLLVTPAPVNDAVCKDSITRGLSIVVKADSHWQDRKTCFSCHHQTMPMFAVTEAARAGFKPTKDWIQTQTEFTLAFFKTQIPRMEAGEHLGGGSYTAAYGLWALSMGEHKPDATTEAIVRYLLKIQGTVRPEDSETSMKSTVRSGAWLVSCRRPPSQFSEIGATVLTLIGLDRYASKSQRANYAVAKTKAEAWLATAPLTDHEDHFWRLWGLKYFEADASTIEDHRARLLKLQREDGGWAQTSNRTSDAYATGQAVVVLRYSGLKREDPALANAARYLRHTQYPDGSWHVATRAKPVQKFFENGDPHGQDQFLSVAATSWATAGLTQLLPQK